MKTKTFTLTMLALIIHAVVIGQTILNQAFQHDKKFVLGYAGYTEAERREFSMVDDPAVLLIGAEELIARAKKMKAEAVLMRGEEQKRMMLASQELMKQAEVKKLAAAELLAYNNRMEFKLLKGAFINSLEHYDPADTSVVRSKRMLLAAVRSFRFATELREEAYAQRSNSATLANLHNAEERENLAIITIVQAMNLLEKVAPQAMAIR